MHYKNGREAKIGDTVTYRSIWGTVKSALLVDFVPSATACNGQAVPLGGGAVEYVTLGTAYHIEDAWAAVDASTTEATSAPPSETQTK